jgi:HlyD family secretion protein
MDHPITNTNHHHLVLAASDEFLPPPGSWSRSIGHQVLMGAGLLIFASCFWPLEETVRASGVVRPTGENVVVQSQLAGRVHQVMVQPNQVVQPNQILAVIDQASLKSNRQQIATELEQLMRQWRQTVQQQKDLNLELRSTVLLSNAQIDSSFGDVDKAKASLAFAASESMRYGSLAKVGAVPELLSQEKAARYSQSKSELRQARLSVTQQRAKQLAEEAKLRQAVSGLNNTLAELARQKAGLDSRLLDASRALANATIRSPIAASVVATSLNHPGQVLSSGEVIARLAPLHAAMEAKVIVPAQSIGKIRVGQKTYLRVTGCPYSEFGLMTGKVTGIAADTLMTTKPGAIPTPVYEVSVQPSNRSLKRGNERCDFRLGMDLQADMMTGRSTVMSFLLKKLRLLSQG